MLEKATIRRRKRTLRLAKTFFVVIVRLSKKIRDAGMSNSTNDEHIEHVSNVARSDRGKSFRRDQSK
jgi:hypothetical protein